MRIRVLFTGTLTLLFALVFFFYSCTGEHDPDPVLVFTQAPVGNGTMLSGAETLPLDIEESRIVSINYEEPERGVKNLTGDFYSAASPSLSFDNERIVFSAKEAESDPRQIWTMNLDGSGKSMIYSGERSCYTPSFLPTGEIVFSCEVNDPVTGTTHPLFKVQPDGSGIEQITYHPHRDLYTSMLADGRIIMISRQVYPEENDPTVMVLRPDGTKAQAFYHNGSDFRPKSTIREREDEKLIFVQSDGDEDQLVAMSYANPLLPKERIVSRDAGRMQSADIIDSGRFLLSARNSSESPFALFMIDEDGNEELLFEDPDYHSVQPVAARKRVIPKKLPTSISPEEGSGIIISQNVNHSQIDLDGDPQTKYVRVEGIDHSLSEFEVADDGSFYLRVESDMPVRFISLDEEKEVLRGPSPWVWLRTNERRACVGCHASKVMAPVNVVPKAIEKDPVIITDTSRAITAREVQALKEMVNQM